MNKITEKARIADTRINDFAVERTHSLQALVDTAGHIDRVVTRERAAAAAPSGASSTATLLPNGSLTREFRELVSRHRSDAEGLTALGLKSLRDDTQADLDELFVAKQFAFRLSVDDIAEAGDGGYRLTASHRPDVGEESVRAVAFHFGGEVRHRLIRCKVGDKIEVEARIRRVSLQPGLPAIEASGHSAYLHLAGDIVAVRSGCGEP